MAPVLRPAKPGASQDQAQTPVVDSGLSNADASGRDGLKNALREGVTSSTHPTPDFYERKDYTRGASKLNPDERDNAHGYAPSSSYKRFSTAPTPGAEVKGDVKMRFGRSDLTPEGQRVVADVVAEIEKIKAANGGTLPPGTKITVDGYTDDRYHGKANGNNSEGIEFNKELSQRRADAVKKAIQKETGIGDDVIEAKGQGISNAHDNQTAKGRALNRRVEVAVEVPSERETVVTKPQPVNDPGQQNKPETQKIPGGKAIPTRQEQGQDELRKEMDKLPQDSTPAPSASPDKSPEKSPEQKPEQSPEKSPEKKAEPVLEPVKSSMDPFIPLRDAVDKQLHVVSPDGLTQYKVERIQIDSKPMDMYGPGSPGIHSDVPIYGYRVSAIGVDPDGPPAPRGSMMYKPGEGWTDRAGDFMKADAVIGAESALEAANNKAAFDRLLKANEDKENWTTSVGDHLARVVKTDEGTHLYVYTPPKDGLGMTIDRQTDWSKFARFEYDRSGSFVQAKGYGDVDPSAMNLADIQRKLWLE